MSIPPWKVIGNPPKHTVSADLYVVSKGNYTLKSQTVPSLYSAIREAAKVVPNPNPAEVEAGRKTVFDTWLWANPDLNDPTQPR